MTVRYMIVTDELDATTTYQVVATLGAVADYLTDDCGYSATTRDVVEIVESGGTVTLSDGRTITVTPVVWRGRSYVRVGLDALGVSDDGHPTGLPLDSGKASV